jgi:hypothetical protein
MRTLARGATIVADFEAADSASILVGDADALKPSRDRNLARLVAQNLIRTSDGEGMGHLRADVGSGIMRVTGGARQLHLVRPTEVSNV